MKCWKCGTDISKGTKTCSSCGVSLVRTKPSTDAGKALRMIFDDFGHEKVLGDPRYIMSSLTDLLPDSELLIYKIEHIYHVGFGKIYEAQIKNSGKPDQPFYTHLRRVLTEDVGFSDSKTEELITYFDEMVGWERPTTAAPAPAAKPKENVAAKPKEIPLEKVSATKSNQSIVDNIPAVPLAPANPVSPFKPIAPAKPATPRRTAAPAKSAAPVKRTTSNTPVKRPANAKPKATASDAPTKPVFAPLKKADQDDSNSYYICDCGFRSKGYKYCPNCGKHIGPASKPAAPRSVKTDSSINKTRSAGKTTHPSKNSILNASKKNSDYSLFNYRSCECGYMTSIKSIPYCPLCGKKLREKNNN